MTVAKPLPVRDRMPRNPDHPGQQRGVHQMGPISPGRAFQGCPRRLSSSWDSLGARQDCESVVELVTTKEP